MTTKDRPPKRSLLYVASISLLFVCVVWSAQLRTAKTNDHQTVPKADASTDSPAEIQINLDKAMQLALPNPRASLRATSFKTRDGKNGWVIRIPGQHAIATPAYADGVLFVGGGYGSHEFYAFNAQTGALIWRARTKDDGPSAAVVEDGYVAFNTESCTIEVCHAKTGKIAWQEWLGDPLMSQPAISKGRLYIAYPSGQRGHQQALSQGQPESSQGTGGHSSHRLLCADLKTGRHLWEREITADVISAPVISGDQVLFTCFDGTSFCLNASTGAVIWTKDNAGTSAPLVANGEVVVTQKEQRDGKDYEGLQRMDLQRGAGKEKKLLAAGEAKYLGEGKGGGVGISAQAQGAADAAVGFSAPPPAAKLEKANKHLGVRTVVGGWAYQGSRPTYKSGQMMNAQGRFINSVRSKDGRFVWRAEVKGAGIEPDSQVFSPPALGEKNMYLCSSMGHVVSVGQKNGQVGFAYSTRKSMAFQPALARGNIYVGTVDGLLICLKTGEPDADGWYAWGGNAQHNK